MSKPEFANRLREETVPLDQILLDPNNPRLIGIENFFGVPEERIAEPGIQARTLDRLNNIRVFDQESLRASIQQSGLLPVDRIVVRPTDHQNDEGKTYFVAVEGNRRLAACKTLLEMHKGGTKTLDPGVIETLREPRVLVLSEDSAENARLDQWVIQGVRHISGIRPWGAYQAAKTIEAMLRKLGYSESEVANALSISIQRVRRSMRVLAALAQMSESEDYSEFATPEYYAYFDEVLKRPAVRGWLGWDNDKNLFENEERLEQFYSWITPDDELDGRSRIGVAESVRKLDRILQDPAALEILNTSGRPIDDALAVAEPAAAPDWAEPLQRALRALNAVPIGDLEKLDDDHRKLVKALIELAQKRLEQADTFKK